MCSILSFPTLALLVQPLAFGEVLCCCTELFTATRLIWPSENRNCSCSRPEVIPAASGLLSCCVPERSLSCLAGSRVPAAPVPFRCHPPSLLREDVEERPASCPRHRAAPGQGGFQRGGSRALRAGRGCTAGFGTAPAAPGEARGAVMPGRPLERLLELRELSPSREVFNARRETAVFAGVQPGAALLWCWFALVGTEPFKAASLEHAQALTRCLSVCLASPARCSLSCTQAAAAASPCPVRHPWELPGPYPVIWLRGSCWGW